VRTYDQLGNMSAWVQSSNTIPLTNSDTTAPTLSNPQLTLQSQANSHVSISWTAAQDNVTAPADMLYSVYLLPGQCSASTVFNEYQKIAAIQGTTFSISLPFELSFCFGVQAEDEAGLTISYNPAHILHTAPSLGSSLQVGNLGSSSQRKVFFEPTTQTHIAIFAKEQSLTVMRSSNGQTWSLAEELATPQIRDFSATVGTVGSSQFLYIVWSDGNGDILGRRA
jgi:hypothetical protein